MAGKHILFVDDEPMVLSAIKRESKEWLTEKSYTIDTAGSVDEALEIIKKEPSSFALVVSDQRMPVKNGTVLLQEIKKQYPLISCILLTAYSELAGIQEAIKAGIISFLQKPWDPEILKSEILRGLEFHELKNEVEEQVNVIKNEVFWAKKIQEELLRLSQNIANNNQISLAYKPLASSDCGGDFYQIYTDNKGRFAFYLGDLETRGVQGTYYSLRILEMIKEIKSNKVGIEYNPADFVSSLNEKICQSNVALPGAVMGLTGVVFDPDKNELVYVCAGGEAFFLLNQQTWESAHWRGPSLGYKAGIDFQNRRIDFLKDNVLIMGSNGAFAGRVVDERRYSDWDQLIKDGKPQNLARSVLNQLEEDLPFSDDATILTFRASMGSL